MVNSSLHLCMTCCAIMEKEHQWLFGGYDPTSDGCIPRPSRCRNWTWINRTNVPVLLLTGLLVPPCLAGGSLCETLQKILMVHTDFPATLLVLRRAKEVLMAELSADEKQSLEVLINPPVAHRLCGED
jgi:hypothetical protein